MLKLLKRLFSKPEEMRHIQLASNELPGWLSKEQKSREQALSAFLAEWMLHWNAHCDHCSAALDKLENAKLVNPNIPDKHKHFMIGNRKEYLRRVRAFIENTNTPNTVEGIRAFLDDWKQSLPELVKGIQRPASILSEFFAVQVRDVQSELAKLENEVKLLSKELGSQLPDVLSRLQLLVTEHNGACEKKTNLDKDIAQLKKQLVLDERRHSSVVSSMESIEKSKEHQKLLKLREELIAVQDKRREAKSGSVLTLQGLNDALARYERVMPSPFIEKLRKSPLEAIEKDTSAFLSLVSDLKQALEQGSLELKPKKQDKAITTCHLLTQDWITTHLTVLTSLRDEEKNLIDAINKTGLVSKFATLRQQEQEVSEVIKRLQKEIVDKDHKVATIDLSSFPKTFVKTARDLNVEITLS